MLSNASQLDERQMTTTGNKSDVQLQVNAQLPLDESQRSTHGEPPGHAARGSKRGAQHAGRWS